MMTDPGNHLRSRLETVATLVRQASQCPDMPYDAATFLASAMAQLSLLEMHLNHSRDTSEHVRRQGDRGFQPAILPHAQTVELRKTVNLPNIGTVEPDSGILTFNLANNVQRAKLAGEK